MSPYIYGLRGSDCTAGDTGGGGYMKDMWGGYTEDIYLTRAESTNNGGGLSLNSGTYTVIRYECHFCKASSEGASDDAVKETAQISPSSKGLRREAPLQSDVVVA